MSRRGIPYGIPRPRFPDMAAFAARLRRIRLERSPTQEAVAARVGIAGAQYSRIETAQRRPPLDLLPKLADAFNVSLEDFLGDLTRGRNDEFRQVKVSDLEDLAAHLTEQSAALDVCWKTVNRLLGDRGPEEESG
jgi:transcriptional regulator with XRE-family HTH domain